MLGDRAIRNSVLVACHHHQHEHRLRNRSSPRRPPLGCAGRCGERPSERASRIRRSAPPDPGPRPPHLRILSDPGRRGRPPLPRQPRWPHDPIEPRRLLRRVQPSQGRPDRRGVAGGRSPQAGGPGRKPGTGTAISGLEPGRSSPSFGPETPAASGSPHRPLSVPPRSSLRRSLVSAAPGDRQQGFTPDPLLRYE
jgi:hypothetical protein